MDAELYYPRANHRTVGDCDLPAVYPQEHIVIAWLQSLPAEWGNYVSMLLFFSLGVLVWLIPLERITADIESPQKWQDIRWWATVLIALQLLIYMVF